MYFHINPPLDLSIFALLLVALIAPKISYIKQRTYAKEGIGRIPKYYWLVIGILGIIAIALSFILIFSCYKQGFYIRAPYIRIISLTLASTSLLLWRQSFDHMGEAFADAAYKSSRLITDGPFILVRNPIYLSYSILYPSIFVYSLVLVHPGFLLITAIIEVSLLISLYVFLKTRIIEEEKLLSDFGAEYVRYTSQTPRLFPTPKSFCKFMKQPFRNKTA